MLVPPGLAGWSGREAREEPAGLGLVVLGPVVLGLVVLGPVVLGLAALGLAAPLGA